MDLSANRVQNLRDRLEEWGRVNIRHYPWRYKKDPYAVLLSEFMLHRTQKDQAQDVYIEFMSRFPDLEAYHEADRDDVRRLLKPLGLNWRIEGMLDVLDSLWEQYGLVPAERGKLIKERNVGQYIAGATATFSRDEPNTLIDTNTVRVIGRVFGLNLEGEARRRKEMREAIAQACDPENPRDFYYAMIDLAHQICLPGEPLCAECPLLEIPCKFGSATISE